MNTYEIEKLWTKINVEIFGFDKLSVVVRVKYKFQVLNKLNVFKME